MMRVAIIGGGAAGMMCMATLVEQGFDGEILLFEKNAVLGAKVSITGGGRCNVTTGYYKKQDILPKLTRGSERFAHAYSKFSAKQTYKWFVSKGCALKIEADNRVFPVSNNSTDVIGTFTGMVGNSVLHMKECVLSIKKTDQSFAIKTDKSTYTVDKVLIAVGGNAYRHTGSTGDGYTRAQELGHTVTDLGPSLSSFLTKETWIHDCSGISFPHAAIKLDNTGHRALQGPLLCTHFGISGPLAFIVASHVAFNEINDTNPLAMYCRPDASKTTEYREKLIKGHMYTDSKKQTSNILAYYIPKKIIIHLDAYYLGGLLSKAIGSLTKDERASICSLLGDGYKLTLIGRRPGDEFVTAGGISTHEINPHTMESTICPGLYFAGEVLDVDGVTGGYNLQVARSTGRCAGLDILGTS